MNGQNANINYNNNNGNIAFSSNRNVSGNEAISRVKKRYKYICYDKNVQKTY